MQGSLVRPGGAGSLDSSRDVAGSRDVEPGGLLTVPVSVSPPGAGLSSRFLGFA
jgi:hypothetical protein